MSFRGEAVEAAFGHAGARVVAAEDDQGNALGDWERPAYLSQAAPIFYQTPRERMDLMLWLSSPKRSARTIRQLHGELMLFHPTKKNGGLVSFPNAGSHVNRWTSLNSGATNEIRFILLDRSGLERVGELAPDMAERLELMHKRPEAAEESNLVVIVQDRANTFAAIELVDEQWKPLWDRGAFNTSGSGPLSDGERWRFDLRNCKLADGAKLNQATIQLWRVAPEALRPVPFVLERISLP